MRRADKLVVLNNGKIECVGKDKDLIKRNKIYKQLKKETSWSIEKYPELLSNGCRGIIVIWEN